MLLDRQGVGARRQGRGAGSEKVPKRWFLCISACLAPGAVILAAQTLAIDPHPPPQGNWAYFVGRCRATAFCLCRKRTKEKIAATLPGTELLTLSDDGWRGSYWLCRGRPPSVRLKPMPIVGGMD